MFRRLSEKREDWLRDDLRASGVTSQKSFRAYECSRSGVIYATFANPDEPTSRVRRMLLNQHDTDCPCLPEHAKSRMVAARGDKDIEIRYFRPRRKDD